MSASVAAADAAPAAADPYSPKVTVKLDVRTPDPIRTHTRLTITIRVTSNSPDQPTGKVRLELNPAPGGGGQSLSAAAGPGSWGRTFDYNGGTQEYRGPQFPKTGDWLLTGVFTPDDPQFRSDQDSWAFTVVDGPKDRNDNAGDGDESDSAGGLLPDTGGPALLWLLLGLVLVGGGATAVVVARRRREPTAAIA